MNAQRFSKAIIYFVMLVFALVSCTPAAPATPTNTAAPSVTPPPTNTSAPTITPSPTPIPGPWYGVPITTENANQVRQLAIWGKGLPWAWGYGIWPLTNKMKKFPEDGLGTIWTNWATDFVSNGNVFVIQTPRGVYLFSNPAGSQIAEIDNAISYKVSDDEKLIVTGHNDGSVKVWDLSSGELSSNYRYVPSVKKDLLSAGGSLIPTVGAVAISPDKKLVAGGFADDYIVVWETSNPNRPLYKLRTDDQSFRNGFRSLAFSPDSAYLLSKGRGGTILWQMSDGNMKFWLSRMGGEKEGLTRPAFSPDGNLAASYSNQYLELFNVRDGSLLLRFNNTYGDVKFSFSSDWQNLFVDYYYPPEKTKREIRSIPDGKLLDTVSAPPTMTVPISLFDSGFLWGLAGAKGLEDHSILAWGSANQKVYWWNFAENKYVGYPTEGENAYFSADGKFAAICQNGKIVVFTSDGIYKDFLVQGHQSCDGIVFSPDQDTFAVWTRNRITLVTMSTSEIQTLSGHQGQITAATFSPNGKLLASAEETYPGQIIIWDTKPAKKHSQITSKEDFYYQGRVPLPYYVIAFSPEGDFLATRGVGNLLRLWNIDDGTQVMAINVEAETVTFSPDSKILATGNRVGIISLWRIPTGEKLVELRGHAHLFERIIGINDYLLYVSFPPDGQDILSVEYESGKTGVLNLSIPSLSFLSDGTGILSVGVDGTVRLWGIDPNSP